MSSNYINNNNEDDEVNASRFWRLASSVPTIMRSTSDQLRLLDIENRQAIEALIDASTKSLAVDPSVLTSSGNNSSNKRSSSALQKVFNDDELLVGGGGNTTTTDAGGPNQPLNSAMNNNTSSSSSSALWKQQNQELVTIDRLEDAVVRTAEKRVEVSKHCLQELRLLVERFREEEEEQNEDDDEGSDEDGESDDDDENVNED